MNRVLIIFGKKQGIVSCKFVRYMKRNIVSLGFPDSVLKRLHDRNKMALMQQTENYRLFVADDSFDVQDFLNWRKNVETESHKLNEDCIEKKLKDYPLEKRTPLEAFLFLQKLQEKILEKNK